MINSECQWSSDSRHCLRAVSNVENLTRRGGFCRELPWNEMGEKFWRINLSRKFRNSFTAQIDLLTRVNSKWLLIQFLTWLSWLEYSRSWFEDGSVDGSSVYLDNHWKIWKVKKKYLLHGNPVHLNSFAIFSRDTFPFCLFRGWSCHRKQEQTRVSLRPAVASKWPPRSLGNPGKSMNFGDLIKQRSMIQKDI